MRKLVIWFMILALLLPVCGCKKQTAFDGEYADQDAFLADMARGISTRLKHVDDEKVRSDEELYQYYAELVNYELANVSKYKDAVFEDALFNELAHEYICGCETQLTGAKNHRQLQNLWSIGSSLRNPIIVYLYQNYNLPITSEEASNYSSGGNATVTYTFTPVQSTDYTDCVSIKKLGEWKESSYHYLGLLVTNDLADCSLNVHISALFYDSKGNLVGDDSKHCDPIGKGETLLLTLESDTPYSTYTYKIESATESSYVSGLKDIKITSREIYDSKNRVKRVFEFKNNSDHTYDSSDIWVHTIDFNGKQIVESDLAYNKSSIGPGEVGYAETNYKKKDYTSYDAYYEIRKD